MLYIRTFIDVLLPILFVTHVRALLPSLASKLLELQMTWKSFAENLRTNRAIVWILRKTSGNPQTDKERGLSLKPVIALLFALLLGIGLKANIDQFGKLRETAELLSVVPESAVVLSSFNRQYQILFARPDLRVIPSSEAGLPAKSIRKEYVSFFKDGSFRELARRTSAEFLIEGKDMYLDPGDCLQLEPIAMGKSFRIWRIRPELGDSDSIGHRNGIRAKNPL